MPTNPLDLTDLVKISILIVKGSQPTGSVARTLLVSTFPTSLAFPGRQKRYAGTAAEVDAALAADGFTAPYDPGDPMSTARAMAAAFFDNELPVDEVVIGRRDSADASYGVTLTEIAAEDNTFCLVGAETRTKAQQLQVAQYCESRWNYYRTLTREPGTLTKAAGTFAASAFLAKYHHTSATYYDAEVATGYGPAVVLGAPGTFVIEDGWTLVIGVGGAAGQEFTFAAAAATSLGSAQVSAINLAAADNILVTVDELGALEFLFEDDPSYFPDGIAAATAAQVVEYLNDTAPQLTWSVDAGAVRATSQRPGSGSIINFTGGTATTKLGLADSAGSGDFAFADSATATEVAALVNATATGFTAEAAGTRLRLTSDDSGEAVYLEVLEAEANDNLGLEVGLYYGTGVLEDWHDCAVLGVLAQLATRLDTPGGSFPLDNQKLRGRPGQLLTTTARKNVWEQFCDTYEPRTQNFPGELHLGVSFSGVNVQFVIGLLWLQLRLSEAVKGLQDNKALNKQTIPYTDDGVAEIDNAITGVLLRWGAAGSIVTPVDLSPYNPLTKVTGYKKPRVAEQSEANRAAGRVSGWRTTQVDAGSIKAVEIEIVGSTQ